MKEHVCREMRKDKLIAPPGQDAQKGAVLILVLWVILAISMLAVSFSASIRTEVDAARNVIDQKQSYYLARAGIEYAVFKIIESQSAFFQSQQAMQGQMEEIPDVLRGHVTLEMEQGIAQVQIADETGKINVNLAPPHLIYNLLVMVGVAGPEADIITDSIQDWLDPDDLIRPFGAESDYYSTLEVPYRAKDGFMDVTEELLLVQGVTPEIYYGRKTMSDNGMPVELYGLQKYLTTFSEANMINVNSAPVPVLAAIPGLDYATALMIEEIRMTRPLMDVGELQQQLPGLTGEGMGFLGVVRSNVYSLTSIGKLPGSKVVGRIRAVVRVDGTGPKGYAVLYWNEADTEL